MKVRGIKKIPRPSVVGAMIDLGSRLDLMTTVGMGVVAASYQELKKIFDAASAAMPVNSDKVRRPLDRAVIERLHALVKRPYAIETVRGVFVGGRPIYPGAGFDAKTHIQIAVRNPDCIKGVFRVPAAHLAP